MERLPRGRKAARNALHAAVAAASLAVASDSHAREVVSPHSTTHESVRTTSRSEMTVTPETLDRAVLDLEQKLAPGGLFARALENPKTSVEEVDAILRYINKVTEHLEVLQRIPSAYPGQNESQTRRIPPKEYFHGTSSVVFHDLSVNGTPQPRYCGGYYIAFSGSSYFTTAKHCVDGTVEESQFFTPGYDTADIAVRFEPNYHGPALVLDPKVSDDTIQGKMVAIQGERVGKPFTRISFLIRMSPVLYEKIFRESPGTHGWLSSQVASSFMIPLQPGDATPNDDKSLPPQGMSGAVVAPWIHGGYRASGPFFGTRSLPTVPAQNQYGISSAMGFVVGVDALREACNQARALNDASGWVTKISIP